MTAASPAPILTPHGHLLFASAPDAPALPEAVRRRLTDAFARGSGHGLLQLGAGEVETVLPAALVFWREFATRYITALCTSSEPAARGQTRIAAIAAPSTEDLAVFVTAVPPMAGAEYLTVSVLRSLWEQLEAALRAEQAQSGEPLQDFFKRHHPAWNLLGRVHFNLAENRSDEAAPFALLRGLCGPYRRRFRDC